MTADNVRRSLSPLQRDQLAKLQPALRDCLQSADLPEAEKITKKIVSLLTPSGHKTKILQCKNWLFECALEAGEIQYAISGFTGIRKLVSDKTRTHVEATALLGICFIRAGKIEEAKIYLKEAYAAVNKISSTARRQQFQRRFLERVEHECILAGLGNDAVEKLDLDEVHGIAVSLIQNKSTDEISEIIGKALPGESLLFLKTVRSYVVLQIPDADRKLLMPPKEAEKPVVIGKKASVAFKRVAWRSLCSPQSEVYKLWTSSLTAVCNGKLITAAVVTSFSGLKIGDITLAAAISALAMKFSAEVFCERFAPESVMIHISDKK